MLSLKVVARRRPLQGHVRDAVLSLGVAVAVVVSAGCGGPAPASTPEALPPSPAQLPSGKTAGRSPGEAAIERGDFKGALAFFSKAVESHPEDSRAWHYLGVSQQALGDLEPAVASYRKAIELSPDLLDAWVNLGAALLDSGDPAGALVETDRALQGHPEDGSLLFNRALALDALDRRPEALAAYRAAVAAEPGSDVVRYSYAEALVKAGSKDQALTLLRQLARGEELPVLASSARLLGRIKEFSLCVTTLDRALGIEQSAELYVNRGLCKHGQGDEAGALADFESATKADDGYAPAHYYVGMHHKGAGKTKEARAALGRAVEIAGDQGVGRAAKRAMDAL